MRRCWSIIAGCGIGDSLAHIWQEHVAQQMGIQTYWILHVWHRADPEPWACNWLNFGLIDFYKRAGLMQRPVFSHAINTSNVDEQSEVMRRVAEATYGEQIDEWFPLGWSVPGRPIPNIAAEFRNRLSFLREDSPPYIAIHPISATHATPDARAVGDIKRMSRPALHAEVTRAASAGMEVGLIGNSEDRLSFEPDLLWLREQFPGVRIRWHRNWMSSVFNAKATAATETCSPFLAALCNVPTTHYMMYPQTFADYTYAFKDFPSYVAVMDR
jgi:hypothetical protein